MSDLCEQAMDNFERLAALEVSSESAFNEEDWEQFQNLSLQRAKLIRELATSLSNLEHPEHQFITRLREHHNQLELDCKLLADSHQQTLTELRQLSKRASAVSAYGVTRSIKG